VGAARDADLWDFCGARRRPLAARRAVSCAGHDAVVGAAGPGAAGAAGVPAEHLRGGPAVEFHEVAFRSAGVQPGVTEVCG
jgi:hypothetical protein